MDDLLLGIDAGTSFVKAVLVTPDGRRLAQAYASYPTHHPRPGWAEQNPDDWWGGAVSAVRRVLARGVGPRSAIWCERSGVRRDPDRCTR
ncbi:MAG: hypothetical protein IPK16_19690 [Anaerolineales bacterium]|nr:hypothetical protein [Anaerolineales bacterium]